MAPKAPPSWPRNRAGRPPRRSRRSRPRSVPTAGGRKIHDLASAASPTSSPSSPPDDPSAVPSPSANPPSGQDTRESDHADFVQGRLRQRAASPAWCLRGGVAGLLRAKDRSPETESSHPLGDMPGNVGVWPTPNIEPDKGRIATTVIGSAQSWAQYLRSSSRRRLEGRLAPRVEQAHAEVWRFSNFFLNNHRFVTPNGEVLHQRVKYCPNNVCGAVK